MAMGTGDHALSRRSGRGGHLSRSHAPRPRTASTRTSTHKHAQDTKLIEATYFGRGNVGEGETVVDQRPDWNSPPEPDTLRLPTPPSNDARTSPPTRSGHSAAQPLDIEEAETAHIPASAAITDVDTAHIPGVPDIDKANTARLPTASTGGPQTPVSGGDDPTLADSLLTTTSTVPVLRLFGRTTNALAPKARAALKPAVRATGRPATSTERRSALHDALALPWPLWLGGVAIGGTLLAVLGAFLLSVLVFHTDWARGALAAGITALIAATLAALLWIARFVAGQQAYSALVLTLVFVTILSGLGVVGIQEALPIHGIEAAHLEQTQQFASAIREYELSGQIAPASASIARTLDEWGEALLAQRRYNDATVRFNTVLTLYPQSGAYTTRATNDLYVTLRTWLHAGATGMPFANAVDFLNSYRTSKTCASACQNEAAALEGQARFFYGEQLYAAADYLDAAQQFVTVQTKLGSSDYAAEARTEAAKAYYAYGKAQVSTPSCANAVPIYKNLASNYANTPEGKSAAQALAAPGTVRGVLTGYNGGNPPTLYLSRQADPANFYYSDNYSASINAKSGAFTFSGVKQNAYFLSAVLDTGGTYEYTLYHDKSSGQAYVVVVGPLCPTNIGSVPFS